jgi:hypothetical protein
MLILRGVEHAFGIPKQILTGFIADGRIEVHVFPNVELLSQLFKLLLMLNVLSHLQIVPPSNHQLYSILT